MWLIIIFTSMKGELITSIQNPKIKNFLALEKSRERREQNLFTIEGMPEIQQACAAGYVIQHLFFCEEIVSEKNIISIQPEARQRTAVSAAVFQKMAVRENSGGAAAIAVQKVHDLNSVKLSANPLLLVMESVEKPGNLGAVLRTADAVGADAVIVCDPLVDFYNPNVVRASVGGVFTNQLAKCTSQEAITWLKKNKIAVLCTYLQASKPYDEIDFTKSSAIVLGTESTGLSAIWREHSDQHIIIPMNGKLDSLNVSNTAAIIAFEARRQRKKTGIKIV